MSFSLSHYHRGPSANSAIPLLARAWVCSLSLSASLGGLMLMLSPLTPLLSLRIHLESFFNMFYNSLQFSHCLQLHKASEFFIDVVFNVCYLLILFFRWPLVIVYGCGVSSTKPMLPLLSSQSVFLYIISCVSTSESFCCYTRRGFTHTTSLWKSSKYLHRVTTL